jgi:hypothetical protein
MTPEITPEAIAGLVILGTGGIYIVWNFVQLLRGK